jgi:microcystin-dependent protein
VSSLESQLSGGATSDFSASDQRPLNAQEYQLLQRLLSDPFSLPMQFKTWLVSYLETSDMTLPLTAVTGLTSALGIYASGSLSSLPAGLILPFGGLAAPTGTKLCNGGAYSRTIESRLFNAIGVSFGAGDGSTTFNVPDIQGRMPVGVAVSGGHVDVNALGKNDGVALLRRRPKHRHTVAAALGEFLAKTFTGAAATGTAATTPSAQGGLPTVGADPVNDSLDAPPYIVVNFVIIS